MWRHSVQPRLRRLARRGLGGFIGDDVHSAAAAVLLVFGLGFNAIMPCAGLGLIGPSFVTYTEKPINSTLSSLKAAILCSEFVSVIRRVLP